jgi:two-component system, sensor histidine kinase and response regulator
MVVREAALLVNVDDNEAARYARTRLLRQAGFAVADARAGEEALAIVGQIAPDLVLLDINLPDVNGIEVCRRLKSNPESASVLVLQISASAITPPHATAALNNGADAYLMEPVDPDVLLATVRAMLRLRKAEQDLAEANSALRAANKNLENTNAELLRSNEDLARFAHIASHDLQEPLRAVIAHVELLSRTLEPDIDEKARQFISVVADSSRRMKNLIDDLLMYSQVRREPASLTGIVNLNHAARWAIENLRESISSSSAEISVSELPSVYGDFVRLGQVFQNLIGNSLKYCKPGVPPNVRIAVEELTPTDCTISLRDNGIGIAKQYWNQIFTPFKRLHNRDIPGTGIGLAVCRSVIEAHHGRIWVESTEGGGSTFYFSLRLAQAMKQANDQ